METPRPWSRRADAVGVVCFWLSLGALIAAREAARGWDAADWPEVAETFAEVGLWALVTPAVFWLVRRWPAERGAWAGRVAVQLAAGVAVAFAVEWATRGGLRPLLTGPLPADREWTLAGTFGRLRLLDEVIVYLAVLAAGYARSALFQVHERRAEAERLLADRARLEAQLAQARLSALRMQLQPHFLFNTLHAVSALVERDPAGVRTLIARLSSLLRRVLDADDAPTVPLADEAAFLRDYLDVQRIRFQGRLEVREDWAPGTMDAQVPPLVLQPLVENAVGHGVSRIEDGVGVLTLSSRRQGDRLTLTVEDNGPGLVPDARGDGAERPGGVGLANVRARLAALYGDRAGLTLAERSGGGVRAQVSLPFEPASRPSSAALPVLADA